MVVCKFTQNEFAEENILMNIFYLCTHKTTHETATYCIHYAYKTFCGRYRIFVYEPMEKHIFLLQLRDGYYVAIDF